MFNTKLIVIRTAGCELWLRAARLRACHVQFQWEAGHFKNWGEGLSRQNLKTQNHAQKPTISPHPWRLPPPPYGDLPRRIRPRSYTFREVVTPSIDICASLIFYAVGFIINRCCLVLWTTANGHRLNNQLVGEVGEWWQYKLRKRQSLLAWCLGWTIILSWCLG